jgi:hypothetical protein
MNTNQKTPALAVVCDALVLQRVPGKLYNTGKHRWCFGTPIRFDSWNHAPSHWMRGPCPNCGSPTSTYGGGWTCHSDHCPSSASNFACSAGPTPEWWETQINVFLDGDAWCATEDKFVNLQESPAGFGSTPRAAYEALLLENKVDMPSPPK